MACPGLYDHPTQRMPAPNPAGLASTPRDRHPDPLFRPLSQPVDSTVFMYSITPPVAVQAALQHPRPPPRPLSSGLADLETGVMVASTTR
jgi:hypothetical protein